MVNLLTTPKRHPIVAERRTALSDEQWEIQRAKGLYTRQRGEPFALPVDKVKQPKVFLKRDMWRQNAEHGVYRPGVKFKAPGSNIQKNVLTWLKDHVNENIPYWYYLATLGHDLHVSTWGELHGKHWHQNWANPFNPEQADDPFDPDFTTHPNARYLASLGMKGFIENLGFLSGGLVTTAFVSEEISELVSAAGSEYADFDFHEVGTSSAAEANTETALVTTSGIARVAGTPTDADPIYRNVATITADATESWEEHGLFNNSTGATMMDRNLTGGQSVSSGNQVQYTYELTKNPEV